ncbi:MAG: hypothetical protein NZ699_15205 [Roseiflexus sp.]|nr:hypothetical protein [Roseiflexus sp.]MCS7290479.1 hypothetical protein [Roseiflexus sp.]MDW8147613.1 hypothetical protein [Roseiflexaceae bacterium]MDW8231543.1 hypothetical protein [Roseiflexaceae bacterium]
MNEHQRQPGTNWGSIIGWLIFLAVIAGGPLLNALQGALGGTVRISPNWLPFIILGLVMLGALVSIIRSINRRNESSAMINNRSSSHSARSPVSATYQSSTFDFDDDEPLPQSARPPFPSSYQSPTYRSASSQPRPVRLPFPSSIPDLKQYDRQARNVSLSNKHTLPPAPRFDPIISPLGVVTGIVGLIVLVGLALYVFGVVP